MDEPTTMGNTSVSDFEPTTLDLATFSRGQRRQFRRAILSEHRKRTRFWRRSWRGVMPQWQVVAIVRSAEKRNQRIDAEYGVQVANA